MKHALATLLAALAPLAPLAGCHKTESPATATASSAASATDFAAAFAQHARDLPVEGQGTVVRLLPDDTEGSRHQRFIVRLASGQTVLLAHNIDLAPRVAPLAEGDTLAFHGVYEWNDKGGVVHWTHHDPQGRHPPGWIRHGGQTFQ